MTIQAGDALPNGTLTTMADGQIKPLGTDELFGGKTVVLFAVPGAFTPTCSAQHLPGFIEHADALRAKGVDTIACLSVNDVFVMDAWGRSQDPDGKVTMLADGNGDYAKALGLELDATGFGMGLRAQRFALVAKDGVVASLHVEAPGEFRVSSAESVLSALD
ncbi:MAG: peroxiredoxin [Pseudomonadota bacterium]